MPGRFEIRDHITREALQAEPQTLFVFGDNLARAGFGGQAREMRGEPNAVGLPTKRRPTWEPTAFLADADLPAVTLAIHADVRRLRDHLTQGGTIVWPAAGIGTGRAQLARRAPAIAAWYERVRTYLERYAAGATP